MTDKGHILVVDDEASLRETFEAFLVDDGYRVTLADSYETAIYCLYRDCKVTEEKESEPFSENT